MNFKNSRIILEDQQRDFLYDKNKSNLRISFNRISFVFFIFLIVFLIYSIHLTHLGSRKDKSNIEDLNREFTKNTQSPYENIKFKKASTEIKDDFPGPIGASDITNSPPDNFKLYEFFLSYIIPLSILLN